MSLNPSQKNSFESRLAYFGGAISVSSSQVKDDFQDLEFFFVDATLRMSDDVRVTQAFLNWLIRYGAILCPSKIKKLLQNANYSPAILGVFVSYLMEYDSRPSKWHLLDSFIKKTDVVLFPKLPRPKQKNSHFEKYGVVAPLLIPNEEKYLLPKAAVLKNCVELKYRSMMMGAVASDIHSLLVKNGSNMTAYEMAKITHHHKAQVYSLIKKMKQLGSFSNGHLFASV